MTKSVRQQFADTMLAVGQEDPLLVGMVGDISHGILKPFAAACPSRYYNIGILEPTMMSMGAGLAAVGFIPVLHTIAPFLIDRAFEQVKLDFCYHGLAGNIVTVGSAFDYSNLGCTHHCYGDFALLKTLPTEICFAASAVEFDQLFRQAYRNDKVTVYRIAGFPHSVAFAPEDIVFGKGIRVTEGEDVTIVATGPLLDDAMTARDRLAARQVSAEVIYIHTIRPLDTELLRASVAKTGKVVVMEEHMRLGGLGDDVLRATYDVAPGLKFHSVSIPDRLVTSYGTYEELKEECGLTPDAVVAAVEDWGL